MYLYRIHREITAGNPIEHGCKNGYEHALYAEVRIKFSSPEPVVSWSGGIETRGSGSSRYRMSENFAHPVTHVQRLQISPLMLITDFCPSPLHWGKNFTSWSLSREWLFHFHGQENWVNQVQFSSFCITTLSETWFTQFPNPNHKTWGLFGVYGGHSVFCKRGPLSIRGLSS